MNINNLFKRSKSALAKQGSQEPNPSQPSASSNPAASSSQNVVSDAFSGRRRTGHRDTNEGTRSPMAPQLFPSRSNDAYGSRQSYGQPPPIDYSIYTSDQDMYTQNDLDTFTFGNANSYAPPITSSSSNPLPRYTGNEDTTDTMPPSDTTPRPSVVANPEQRSDSSQQEESSRRAQDRTRDPGLHPGRISQSRSTGTSQHDLTDDERGLRVASRPESRSRSRNVEDRSPLYLSEEEDFDLDDFYVPEGQPRVSAPVPIDPYARRPSKSLDDLRTRNTEITIVPVIQNPTLEAGPSNLVPGSFPGTYEDWQEASKRMMQINPPSAAPVAQNAQAGPSSGFAPADIDLQQFAQYTMNGVVDFNLEDMSDVMNVVPATTARRHSTVSSTDIMFKNIHGLWAKLDTKEKWTFSLKTSTKSSGHKGGVDPQGKDKNKEKEKEKAAKKAAKEQWKGMPAPSEEIWTNPSIGRFTVSRKAPQVTGPNAPQQPKVNIYLYRHPRKYIANPIHTTIHRHSRSRAFSIYRAYRRPAPPDTERPQGGQRPRLEPPKPKQPMILLAPLEIQQNSTCTNTTRRLESHGLLDEPKTKSSKDQSRPGKESDREKSSGRSGNDKGKGRSLLGNREVSRIPLQHPGDSSAGSVANAITRTSSEPFIDFKLAKKAYDAKQEKARAEEAATRAMERTRSRGQEVVVAKDDDDDDLDSLEKRRKDPSRTPYNEVYGTLPPSAFEVQPETRTFWGGRVKQAPSKFDYTQPYNPPWPVSHPRTNNQKNLVDDLNDSFTGLGLLPPIGERSGSSRRRNDAKGARDKEKGKQLDDNSVFAKIPQDSLFMIIPLWPGETDGGNDGDLIFNTNPPPLYDRRYLVVLYRITPKGFDDPSSKSKGKKRASQNALLENEAHIMFTSPFQISARVITHMDLQGTGIRVPEHGLAVTGSLQEAMDSIPRGEIFEGYTMIAICDSRNRGVSFLGDGFAEIELATRIPSYKPAKKAIFYDEAECTEEQYVPTPIGSAIMEMAWAGAIAVTSFHPAM